MFIICQIVANLALMSLSMAWYYPMARFYLPAQLYSSPGREYPPDYDPDDGQPITFNGIYDRRRHFDVETPMEYPEPEGEPEEPVPSHHGHHGHHHHHHSHDDDPSHDPSDGESDDNELADDSPQESDPNKILSDGCLRCICEASSDCDPQVRCHVEGPVDYRCGPFQIDVNYWNDAGSPGADHQNPMDFEDCMADIECSIDTVNGYMKEWAKDCDGDGNMSCDDYAKTHKAGKYQCNSTSILSTPYWKKYKECYFE